MTIKPNDAENHVSENSLVQSKNESKNKLKLQEINDFEHIEGGWGWVVVIATGYCFGILIGMVNNYALIYVELDRVYNGTENRVLYSAWIGSVSVGVQYIFCVFGSILIDLFSPMKIGLVGGVLSTLSLFSCAFVRDIKLYFFTYGFLFGVGQSFLLASTLSILPHYFKMRLSLANGIMNLIGSVIIVLIPIFTSMIIDSYGLKITFFFLTSINSITILLVLTYKSKLPKNEKITLKDEIKRSFGIDVLKKKKFVFWCFATFLGKFGYFIPIVNIDHYAKIAFPDKKPVIVNIVFSVCAGIAGIIFGKIGDLTVNLFNRVHYHTLVYLLYGIVQVTIPFAVDYFAFMIQMVLLGIIDGILLSFIVPISVDLAESSKLGNQAAGYYHISMSATAIAGPAVAGQIFEVFNSYDIAFYIGGATSVFAGLVLLISICSVDFYEKKAKRSKIGFEAENKINLENDLVTKI